MSKPVEFSKFYRLLNDVKNGNDEKKEELKDLLIEYEKSENCDSGLHELGQLFCYVGIMELYKYAETEDLQKIGQLSKEEWDAIANKHEAYLPPRLANKMIDYFKSNEISKRISKKWDMKPRQINKEVMGMARYITEGIIDSIE